jgi:hypothetical protein
MSTGFSRGLDQGVFLSSPLILSRSTFSSSKRIRIRIRVVIPGRNRHLGHELARAGFRLKTPVVEGDELQLTLEPTRCRRRKNAKIAKVAGGTDMRDLGVVFRSIDARGGTTPDFT